jgi:formylglycine-generating enzyme required for sulfatase activity
LREGLLALQKEGMRWKEALLGEVRKRWGDWYFFQGEQMRYRDRGQARVYYEKACASGHREACRRSKLVAGEKQERVVSGVKFALRWIPAGEFTMGSPADEANRENDEGPQRRVRISQGYWMMEHEVTQGQWRALMGSNPAHFWGCGDKCPVEKVSWVDSALFANKLSQKEGLPLCFTADGRSGVGDGGKDYVDCKGWRLPTEAEWEYAARAGTTTPHHGKVDEIAWYSGNAGIKTHPVCRKERNKWKLCDVSGNVWEWVYDWYHADAYQQLSGDTPSVDPVFIKTGSDRSVRGGSWGNGARYARSASRSRNTPTWRNINLGLRLLRR